MNAFVRKHDGSDCGGGMCRSDARCDSHNCPGHPRNVEARIAANPVGVEAALPIQYIGPEPRRRIGWWPVVVVALLAWIAVIYGR